MGKKGRKTRWRKLPIPIGIQGGGGQQPQSTEDVQEPEERDVHPRMTFNEDEYTKITTPRQDMLFKKGYLSKKRPTPVQQMTQDTADSQSGDSAESEQYWCEEQAQQQFMYPAPASYIDHSGMYFINSNYEIYDPYTGNMTYIMGPPAQYPAAAPVLTAVPCQTVPLQPMEWYPPQTHPWVPPQRKKPSSADSQNCSAHSSESTCPPSSPQEPVEGMDPQVIYTQPPYVYPGYMFGAPLYNVNGVSVQGVVPQTAQPADTKQRRKKRRRRRRGGVTDEGSESSCEEHLAGASGASSDTNPGSVCSKTNSDSGVHTDPTPNSGSNSPQPDTVCSPPPIFSPVPLNEEEDTLQTPEEVPNELFSESNETVETTADESQETVEEEIEKEEAEKEEEEEKEEVVAVLQPEEVFEEVNEVTEEELEKLEEDDEGKEDCGEEERCQVLERLVESATDEIIEAAVIEANKRTEASERPITEAVTRWLEATGSSALSCQEDDSCSDDDTEDLLSETGQKNADGNPCPASYLSDGRTRVASHESISTPPWDLLDHNSVLHLCDPRLNVDKYYRLTLIKTAVHFGRGVFFPCAVCCLIQ